MRIVRESELVKMSIMCSTKCTYLRESVALRFLRNRSWLWWDIKILWTEMAEKNKSMQEMIDTTFVLFRRGSFCRESPVAMRRVFGRPQMV